MTRMPRFPVILLLAACPLISSTQDPVLERDLLIGKFNEPESHYYRNYWIRQPVFAEENKGHDVNEAKLNVYPPIHPAFLGEQVLEFGDVSTSLSRSNLNSSFFIGGERSYEVGTLRGAFLERGILFGDETGIWSQPFKILDGVLFEVSIDGSPFTSLNAATRVVNRMYCVDFHQEAGDIRFRRRDIPAADEWAFFHQLEVLNKGAQTRLIRVRVSFQSNIRPIWHKPWFVEYGEDVVRIAGKGRFTARDRHIHHVETAFGMACGELSVEQTIDSTNPYRPRGVLAFEITLEPDASCNLDFGSVQFDAKKVSASARNLSDADTYLEDLLGRMSDLVEQRKRSVEASVFDNARFVCPDKTLQDAYFAALYNINSLSVDTRPYLQYPHLMTAPERGYQLLFGIDTLYASIGAASAGFRDIVRSTLQNHLYYAEQTGNHGIHFYVDHFGRHGNRGGRAQETAQFIGAFWEYVKVSGDGGFARAAYPQLKELFAAVEALDENKDLWPDGMTFPSLTEHAGTRTMLSAATRLCWAAEAMGRLAASIGMDTDAHAYLKKADALKRAFEKDWWIEEKGIWAVGLLPNEAGHTQVSLDDYHARSLHYPQTYRIAPYEKGRSALSEIERRAVDAKGGLHAPAVTVWQNSLMALAAYYYNLPELGYRLLHRAARNPIELDKMLGAFSTMNPLPSAIPDNENKIMYCWSAGPFIEGVLCGLMGIQPDSTRNALAFDPQIPADWETASVTGYMLGHHVVDFSFADGVWTVTHRDGRGPLEVTFGRSAEASVLKPGQALRFLGAIPSQGQDRDQ